MICTIMTTIPSSNDDTATSAKKTRTLHLHKVWATQSALTHIQVSPNHEASHVGSDMDASILATTLPQTTYLDAGYCPSAPKRGRWKLRHQCLS